MLGNGVRSATTQNRMQTQGRGRRTNSLMEKVIFCLGGKDRCKRNECLGPKDRGDEGANAAEQSPVSPRHWSHRPEGLVASTLRFCGSPWNRLLTLFLRSTAVP